MKWDTVIGLEVHAQLATATKLFSAAPTVFGAPANTQTSFVDAGFPGTLPVLNREAVLMALKFGLAINGQINDYCFFERKNYFYPDLPKGYQISQYAQPIISNGYLNIEDGNLCKKIWIERAHLEEDAGKLIHDPEKGRSMIDLNRAGIPLLEIVTAPCLHSINEAILYLKTLHQLLRFLGICDGNMQEGSFRCDANISLKPKGSQQLGCRVELKNLNSFRFIEKALTYEQQRQQLLLDQGRPVSQETRLFCENTGTTKLMRSKETAQDYRYIPDPDLLPINLAEFDQRTIKNNLPPLPFTLKNSLQQMGLHKEDIQFLLASPANYNFYAAVVAQGSVDHNLLVQWLRGSCAAVLKEHKRDFSDPPFTAQDFFKLVNALQKETITAFRAKKFLAAAVTEGSNLADLVAQEEIQTLVPSASIEEFIEGLLRNNPQQVYDYQQGNEKIFGYFIGKVMHFCKGQADPKQIHALLKKFLH